MHDFSEYSDNQICEMFEAENQKSNKDKKLLRALALELLARAFPKK